MGHMCPGHANAAAGSQAAISKVINRRRFIYVGERQITDEFQPSLVVYQSFTYLNRTIVECSASINFTRCDAFALFM